MTGNHFESVKWNENSKKNLNEYKILPGQRQKTEAELIYSKNLKNDRIPSHC